MKVCVGTSIITRVRFPFIGSALLLLLLLFAPSASGTVIYVRVSAGEVVIAADSKRVVKKPDGREESMSVCKINQVEDVAFANAGIAGDTGIGLDVDQVAGQSMSAKGTLVERVKMFQQLIQAPLLKTLELIRTGDPARYSAMLRSSAIQTVFMRVENHAPVVLLSDIQPIEDSNGTMRLGSYLVKLQRPEVVFSVGGSPGAEDLEKAKDFWDKGSIAGVRELMKVSIADNSRETGEPIDILKLTKDGPLWIQGKPGCKGNEKAS